MPYALLIKQNKFNNNIHNTMAPWHDIMKYNINVACCMIVCINIMSYCMPALIFIRSNNNNINNSIQQSIRYPYHIIFPPVLNSVVLYTLIYYYQFVTVPDHVINIYWQSWSSGMTRIKICSNITQCFRFRFWVVNIVKSRNFKSVTITTTHIISLNVRYIATWSTFFILVLDQAFTNDVVYDILIVFVHQFAQFLKIRFVAFCKEALQTEWDCFWCIGIIKISQNSFVIYNYIGNHNTSLMRSTDGYLFPLYHFNSVKVEGDIRGSQYMSSGCSLLSRWRFLLQHLDEMGTTQIYHQLPDWLKHPRWGVAAFMGENNNFTKYK